MKPRYTGNTNNGISRRKALSVLVAMTGSAILGGKIIPSVINSYKENKRILGLHVYREGDEIFGIYHGTLGDPTLYKLEVKRLQNGEINLSQYVIAANNGSIDPRAQTARAAKVAMALKAYFPDFPSIEKSIKDGKIYTIPLNMIENPPDKAYTVQDGHPLVAPIRQGTIDKKKLEKLVLEEFEQVMIP